MKILTYFPSSGAWQPIGSVFSRFNTTFEGNGHTISNLYINRNTDYTGLFGYISINAVIKNVGLIGGLVRTSSSSSLSYSGTLVGQSRGEISSSYSSVDISSSSRQVGALVGYHSWRRHCFKLCNGIMSHQLLLL